MSERTRQGNEMSLAESSADIGTGDQHAGTDKYRRPPAALNEIRRYVARPSSAGGAECGIVAREMPRDASDQLYAFGQPNQAYATGKGLDEKGDNDLVSQSLPRQYQKPGDEKALGKGAKTTSEGDNLARERTSNLKRG